MKLDNRAIRDRLVEKVWREIAMARAHLGLPTAESHVLEAADTAKLLRETLADISSYLVAQHLGDLSVLTRKLEQP